MKYLSNLIANASGALGGSVFSHARGTLYMRSRRVPVNPRTAFQTTVRNILSNLQAAYPLLTPIQQAAWAVYGANVTRTNALGQTMKLTAQQWYVACNTARVQAGMSRIDDAPVDFSLCELTEPTVAITAAGTSVDVSFDNGDEWADVVGGALLVYASRPQNGTKNFFIGPYRLAGAIDGAATPPTSPATITLPFPSGPAGSSQFFKFVSVASDGRISTPVRVRGSV